MPLQSPKAKDVARVAGMNDEVAWSLPGLP